MLRGNRAIDLQDGRRIAGAMNHAAKKVPMPYQQRRKS